MFHQGLRLENRKALLLRTGLKGLSKHARAYGILASGKYSDWALAEGIGLRRLTGDFPLRAVCALKLTKGNQAIVTTRENYQLVPLMRVGFGKFRIRFTPDRPENGVVQ